MVQQKPTKSSDGAGFSSNPFTSMGKGIGVLFSANPLTSMIINFVIYLLIIPYIFVLLLAVVNVWLFLFGLFALIAAYIIAALRIEAGTIVLYAESEKGNAITTKHAVTRAVDGHILPLFLSGLLTVIAVLAGLMLFIIPGLIVIARLSLVPFVVVNEKKSGIAALRRSWNLTKGHAMEMWGTIGAQAIVGGYSAIAIIFSFAGLGNRYSELVAHEKAGKATGPVHWLNYLMPILMVLFIAFFVIVSIASEPTVEEPSYRRGSNSFLEYR